MKKKFLCLCVGVTMLGSLITGCGSKDMRPTNDVAPATYEELKTATEEAYKDFTNGKVALSVDLDVTDGENNIKGTAVVDITIDKDTAHAKVNIDGFEDVGLSLDEFELYLDLENKLAYASDGNMWTVTEDASIDSLLGEFGVSMDTEDTPEVDIKEEDIKVEITENGYVIKKSYTGKELMEMLGTGEEENTLVLFAAIIEGLDFTVEAEFNTDKVLNDIDFIVKANDLDLGEGMKLNGTLGICTKITDIGKCDVAIPQEVIDSAKPNVQEDEEDFGEGFEIDGDIYFN